MEHKLTFLDGAMGTMLQRHGLKLGEIPELLAITNPDLLTNIHRQYIEAGTEIVYANTFGANRRKMQKTPYTVADVVSAAISAAKKACIGTSARVALDIGPLGELLEPMGTLPFETAVDMFAEIVDAGVNAGADRPVRGKSRPACRKGAFDAARVGDDELRRDRAHLHRLHNSVHGADAGRLGCGRDWAELLAGAEAAAAALSGALPRDDPARDCQTERGSARPG